MNQNKKMARRSLLRYSFEWFSTTIGLSLLQLWTGLIFGYLISKPLTLEELFVSGGLIFYANSLSLSVASECRNRLEWIAPEKRESFETTLTTKTIPFLSLWLSVIVYCAVVVKATSGSFYLPLVLAQIVLVSMALSYSAWHFFRTARELEIVRFKRSS
jgi:hypothetical protein